ncbi:hypothetical protein CONLIGDRAFT_681109 [Coniochaeta ligniaria NRRL 30616]|uniref:Uncharacterized protein n=1 Tax=Coniochaeta ligniaria NRRL 30616 TaxID=1408157 RepID=A0A1J7JRE9_9PEZI|nr:hypothetical protein CONLIGDRAFT_681109 [Coniochaeta ligniaria NRRL 30616]
MATSPSVRTQHVAMLHVESSHNNTTETAGDNHYSTLDHPHRSRAGDDRGMTTSQGGGTLLMRVAIETGVELETIVIQQDSRKALSPGPRDAATSPTNAAKRRLGTLIPRRDAGENTPETAFEIENESESEITRGTANSIVFRSTRGILIPCVALPFLEEATEEPESFSRRLGIQKVSAE